MDFFAWADIPAWWPALIAASLLGIALLLWWVEPGTSWRRTRRHARIRAEGQPAPATVLAVRDTRVRAPLHCYVLRLTLRVEPAGRAPFETSVDAPVSPLRFADFAEGSVVRVRFAPATGEVALEQRTE